MLRFEFKIPKALFKKIKDGYEKAGFSSVSAYVRFILNKHFSNNK